MMYCQFVLQIRNNAIWYLRVLPFFESAITGFVLETPNIQTTNSHKLSQSVSNTETFPNRIPICASSLCIDMLPATAICSAKIDIASLIPTQIYARQNSSRALSSSSSSLPTSCSTEQTVVTIIYNFERSKFNFRIIHLTQEFSASPEPYCWRIAYSARFVVTICFGGHVFLRVMLPTCEPERTGFTLELRVGLSWWEI